MPEEIIEEVLELEEFISNEELEEDCILFI